MVFPSFWNVVLRVESSLLPFFENSKKKYKHCLIFENHWFFCYFLWIILFLPLVCGPVFNIFEKKDVCNNSSAIQEGRWLINQLFFFKNRSHSIGKSVFLLYFIIFASIFCQIVIAFWNFWTSYFIDTYFLI